MIPEERYICKYCIYCECNEQTEGTAICDVDIREQVDVNHPSCYCFVYDDTFKRYQDFRGTGGKGKMKVVKKKILTKYFKAVRAREKNFEIRKDEDNIQIGDLIVLEEWDDFYGYSGQVVRRYVKYVLRNAPEFGLKEGYCIIGW